MTTYTIAMDGDVLMATAPDDDDAMLQERLNHALLHAVPPEDREASIERMKYYSGLTLYATVEDADEAEADVIYCGCEMGDLQDATGKYTYDVAGYAKQA